jgi:hypothetical protein
MTMNATVLHQNQDYKPEGDIDIDAYGTWERSQDPLTHEIVRVWKPKATVFDPFGTPNDTSDDVTVYDTIPCIARGIVDGGIRVAGTTERFGDSYENIDFVKMWIPANIIVSKRDRITNIRDPRGRIIWVDEEFSDPAVDDTPRATVFDVNGVTPLFNAFNRHTESFVLLQRSTTRGEGAP